MAKSTITSDRHGYFVEWYKDDDNDSGCGDNPKVSRWYGSHAECVEREKLPPPKQWFSPFYDSSNDVYWASVHERSIMG